MAPPDRIGRIGTVVITYRSGYSGPTTVGGMPEYDFGRLQALVEAYVGHAAAAEKLNDHPNRRTRNQVRGALGLPLQGPELAMPAQEFEFPAYRTTGWRTKRAASQQTVKLTPKHIQSVEFVNPIDVSN